MAQASSGGDDHLLQEVSQYMSRFAELAKTLPFPSSPRSLSMIKAGIIQTYKHSTIRSEVVDAKREAI